MRRLAVSGLLLLVAIVHLLPLVGVLGPRRLETLYGIVVDEPNLELLLRHRAVLFGLLGAFVATAAFKPVWQPLALAAGFVSVVSFLGLAPLVGDSTAAIRRVVTADWVALGALLAAGMLMLTGRPLPS